MFNNLSEFKTQYALICKPALEGLQKATDQYNSALKTFMASHFSSEKDFEEWRSKRLMDSEYVLNCIDDSFSETMVLVAMVSEIESNFHSN